MRVFKQLLKEFWLPLLLAVLWTIYNFHDADPTTWDTRKILNVFGPTFFFMTWIVAQWFRVRKQQKVEEGLGDIRKSVKSLNQPLLPSTFLFTIRRPTNEHALKQIANLPKGKNLLSNPEFIGLMEMSSASNDKFRMQIPGGFVDVEEGRPVKVGTYSLQHPGLNLIEEPTKELFIRLDREDIEELLSEKQLNQDFFPTPHSFSITPLKKKDKKQKSFTLKCNAKLPTPVGCVIADNMFYTHFVISANEVENPTDDDWSFSDIKDSEISFRLRRMLISGLNSDNEDEIRESKLHNFQWIAGKEGNRILWFSGDMLANQTWRDSEFPIAKPSKMIELALTQAFSESDFEKQSIRVS